MDTVALCGVILISAVVMLIIRDQSKAAASVVGIAVTVGVFSFVFLRASHVYGQLSDFASNSSSAPYVKTLLKGLGISYLTAFTAATCRDLGSDNSARVAELIGKTELIVLSVPLVADLINLAGELIG